MKPDLYNQARRQLDEAFQALQRVYADYVAGGDSAKQRSGIGQLFQGWFSSSPTLADTKGLAFFEQVALAVKEMEQVCSVYADGLSDLGFPYVQEAARLMVLFEDSDLPRDIKMYLIAAEFHLAPLLPHLTRDELSHLHTQYLARTPSRSMLPNQRRLLAQMEQLLSHLSAR